MVATTGLRPSIPAPTSYDDALLPPLVDEPVAPRLPSGPVPPAWYTKPPEPKLSEVLDRAEEERAAHEERVAQGQRMARRFNQDETMAGVFPRLHKKVLTFEVERVTLPGLRDEMDALIGFAAQMDWVPEALYRSSLDREKAAAKEDCCVYLQENAQRQYSRSGGGDLKAAKMWDLLNLGAVAEFNGIDVDNDECGLRMRLLDPQTVFPVWEGERGLAQVYLKYDATAADFIGTFGSMADFDEDAVREAATANDRYDPHHRGEVVEYWDRHWCLVAFESKKVLRFAHGYAEVPMTVTPGNFGMPAHVRSPSYVPSRSSVGYTDDRAGDLMRVWQPFLERRVKLHELEEANTGVVETMFRRSLNPSRTYAAGVLTYEDESPEVSSDEGHINKVREGEELDIDVIGFDPQVASAVYASMQQAKATSTPSSLIAGQAPMSQGSGTALNVLARSGFERWALAIKVMQQHETMATEQRLRLLRDYGPDLGMDGTIYVPRRGRPNSRVGQSAAHEVTAELLKETGVRVEVVFRRFNPSELTSLAQGVGMLRSLNMMTRRSGIEVIGYTADPDREIEEIDREMLNEVPEIAQVNMLDALIDDLREAGWRGKDEDVEELAYKLMYVASRTEIEANTRQSEQAQSQQMKLAATLMPGANGLTGAMGLPTGTEGGNAPGPNGAPPNAGPPGLPSVPGYG